MGVKELWTVLAPVKEQLPLSALSGKTIAVDLSGWVCQAANIPSPKPHLRQLFVRVCRLSREGVRLVVVLDGEAIQLKWGTMDSRAKAADRVQRSSGQRSMLNRLIMECVELLDAMGVAYCRSRGEAEALCALLNQEQLVHGVFTQDGDAFLYGATVVYKDLSITDSTVDCYSISRVQSELGLTRTDLISLGLLVGCDYCPQGVPGVGRAAALNFIADCKPRDSLEILKSWAGGSEEKTKESKVRRLSRGVIGFPNMAVIREFTSPLDRLPSSDKLVWRMPLVQDIQVFCNRSMEWSFESTLPKAQLLLTQWVVARQQGCTDVVERPGLKCSLEPVCIVKSRKERKVACFEVKWCAQHSQAGSAGEICADEETMEFTTVEYSEAFEDAYPGVVEQYEKGKLEKQKHKRRPRAKESQKLSPKSPLKSLSKELTSPPLVNHHSEESSLESPSKLTQTSLKEYISPSGKDVQTSLEHSPNSTLFLDVTGSDSDTESLMERLKANRTTASNISSIVPSTAPQISLDTCDTSSLSPLDLPPATSKASGDDIPPSTRDSCDPPLNTRESCDLPSITRELCDLPSSTRESCDPLENDLNSSIVVSSDEEEPLPLFARLQKSPVKTKTLSPTKQAKINSYFTQKKSVPKTTKKLPSNGTKSAPILID